LRKPWVTLTIDKDLLEKLDHERGKKISNENRNISRSAYICDLLQKGLKEVK
jgi:metal-responsive CopG/Arc/MetJ family transcriptional regulator